MLSLQTITKMTTVEMLSTNYFPEPSKLNLKLLGLVVFVSTILVLQTWRKKKSKKLESEFDGPTPLPLIGNVLELLNLDAVQILNKFLEFQQRYTPPFRIYIGPKQMVFIGKPDDIQIVLNSPSILEKDDIYQFFKDAVGTGIFTAPVERWKCVRRALGPAFNPKLLEEFLTVFNEETSKLMQKLKRYHGDGTEHNIWEDVSTASLSMTCLNTMGIKINVGDERSCRFIHAHERAAVLAYNRAINPILHSDFLFKFSSYGKELKELCKIARDLPREVFKKRKNEFIENKNRIINIEDTSAVEKSKHLRNALDILLELNYKGIPHFSDEDVLDDVTTLMVGGSETSAVTNCFCLLALAIHPEIQDKVYEEQMQIFQGEDRPVTMADLREMTYTEQVIKETLRLFSPVPLTLRVVQQDTQITGNHVLSEGTTVVISPYTVHLNPDIWPEPRKFNPDRFSEENLEKQHRYAFIAFNAGPRGCLGSRYAMMSIKTTISIFIRHYKVMTTTKLEDIELAVDILARSKNGWNISLESRNHQREDINVKKDVKIMPERKKDGKKSVNIENMAQKYGIEREQFGNNYLQRGV